MRKSRFRLFLAISLTFGLMAAFQSCGMPVAEHSERLPSLMQKTDLEEFEQQLKSQVQLECQQDSDCRAIGLGSKPCGGPRQALVYSALNIDDTAFIDDVESFNQSEQDYNRSINAAGTCDYVMLPNVLSCQNNVCQGDYEF